MNGRLDIVFMMDNESLGMSKYGITKIFHAREYNLGD